MLAQCFLIKQLVCFYRSTSAFYSSVPTPAPPAPFRDTMARREYWTRLPVELQEQVLLCGEIPDLIRWRTVCKGIETLILSANFKDQYVIKHGEPMNVFMTYDHFFRGIDPEIIKMVKAAHIAPPKE